MAPLASKVNDIPKVVTHYYRETLLGEIGETTKPQERWTKLKHEQVYVLGNMCMEYIITKIQV